MISARPRPSWWFSRSTAIGSASRRGTAPRTTAGRPKRSPPGIAKRASRTATRSAPPACTPTNCGAPVVSGLPEDACLTAALERLPELRGPLNLVSVGARGYSVLTRDHTGRVQAVGNDKCSSGTGETMVRIAGRFGLDIEEADALARGASDTIPITARCSVFAKSEMTHFGNQGRPADALFRGYFGSIARYVAALLARARVEGPVLRRRRLRAHPHAGRRARRGGWAPTSSVPELVSLPRGDRRRAAGGRAVSGRAARTPSRRSGRCSFCAHAHALHRAAAGQRVAATASRCLEAAPVAPGAERAPSVLGLDLGSTGSKAVLTSIATGETRARPLRPHPGQPGRRRRSVSSAPSSSAPRPTSGPSRSPARDARPRRRCCVPPSRRQRTAS